jgi:hypothetical protein
LPYILILSSQENRNYCVCNIGFRSVSCLNFTSRCWWCLIDNTACSIENINDDQFKNPHQYSRIPRRFMKKVAAAVLLGPRVGQTFDAIVTGIRPGGGAPPGRLGEAPLPCIRRILSHTPRALKKAKPLRLTDPRCAIAV